MNNIKRIIAVVIAMVMMTSQFSFSSYSMTTPEDSQIIASESRGLRVQLFASTWGLSGKWFKTDLLGVTRMEASKFDLSEAARALGLNRSDIKRVRVDGFIKPIYRERYTFTTNHNDDLKMWIDDKLVINYGIVNDIQLDNPGPYKIEVEMQNKGYDGIKIYWKSASQERKLISFKNTLTPQAVEEIPRRELSNIDYNPKSDTDGDGIPDAWERNGYTVQEGIVMPYEASLHAVKYVTDDRKRSTDGDPYTDFEEVTGINMDQSVKAPGNHPLVPAYPKIEFVPTSVKIIPSKQNESVKSIKIGTGISEKVSAEHVDTETAGGYTKGFNDSKIEIGSKYEANSATGSSYVGAYYKMDSTGGMNFNSRSSIANEVKNITGSTTKDSSSETDGETEIINTTDYAYLEVNGYYRNSGTATAYSVDPTMSLSILGEEFPDELAGEDGDTIVKTFKVADVQKPHIIGPEVNYPANGNVNLSLTTTTEGYLPTPIRLTKTQADKLELGYPFKIDGHYLSYIENTSKLEEKRWSSYEHAINEVSATIKLSLPKASVIERKIYAGSSKQPLNLIQGLQILFGGKLNESGNLVIDGYEIKSVAETEWGIKVKGPRAAIDDLNQQMKNDDFGYEKLLLAPGLDIEIFKKDNAAKANVINAYYNPNDSRIYATVIPGSEALASVSAKIKTDVEQTVTLVAKENDKYLFSSEPLYNISTSYNNHIVATSEGNKDAIGTILIDSEYLKSNAKQGLNYLQYPHNSKPYSNPNTLRDARNYVTNNTQHKYYGVMIGENIRRGLEKRQLNYSVRFGEDVVYNQAEYESMDSVKNINNYLPVSMYVGAYTYYDGWRRIRERTIDRFDSNSKLRGQLHYLDIPTGEYYSHMSVFRDWDKKRITKLQLRVTVGDGGREVSPTLTHYVYGSFKAHDFWTHYERVRQLYNSKTAVKLKHMGVRSYKVTPPAEHTQFAIISREDLLTYLNTDDGYWNANTLVILGMLTEDQSGKAFIPDMKNYVTISGGTSEIASGINVKPDAYMLNVKKTGTDPGVVKIGNATIGLNTGNGEDHHQDIVITDAKDNGKINSQIPNGKSVQTQMLGYFIDKNQLNNNQKYLQYWIPENPIERTLMPQFDNGNATMRVTLPSKDINVKGYPVRPKGFIIKVDQLGVGTKKMELEINGQTYRMDVGIKMGNEYNSINHTGYVFVSANNDNAYVLDMNLNVDTTENQGRQGEVQLKVLGFYYENLY